MQLMSPAFSTTSTRKRKIKLTDSKYHKMALEWADYNKRMKKLGASTKTIDEYISYRQGKFKPEIKGVVKDPLKATTFRRESPVLPSYGDQVGSIPAKPEQKYTGDHIIGVAVLHKSCLQPVSSRKDAEDIAKMRRG